MSHVTALTGENFRRSLPGTLALIFYGSIRSRRSPSMTFVVPRIEETAGAPRKALSADFYFEAVLKSPKITKFGTVAEG